MNRKGVRLSEATKTAVRADLANGMNPHEIHRNRGISKTAVYKIRDDGEPYVPEPEAPLEASDPRALYAKEKALADARRPDRLAPAKAAFQALLEREAIAGRGGRPKGVKVVNSLNVSSKPGKPQLNVTRSNPVDALVEAVPYYGPQRRLA